MQREGKRSPSATSSSVSSCKGKWSSYVHQHHFSTPLRVLYNAVTNKSLIKALIIFFSNVSLASYQNAPLNEASSRHLVHQSGSLSTSSFTSLHLKYRFDCVQLSSPRFPKKAAFRSGGARSETCGPDKPLKVKVRIRQSSCLSFNHVSNLHLESFHIQFVHGWRLDATTETLLWVFHSVVNLRFFRSNKIHLWGTQANTFHSFPFEIGSSSPESQNQHHFMVLLANPFFQHQFNKAYFTDLTKHQTSVRVVFWCLNLVGQL